MSSGSLWPRIEPLLSRVERPSRYIDHEWNALHAEGADYRAVLAYPDTYELGQANQALQILYGRLHAVDGVSAERVYVPWVDMGSLMRADALPLFSLESATAVRDADLLGVTLPYELTYTNVLELLDLAGIPLWASARGADDPLVVGGGPCAFNPEPVAPFFDAILLGEGEEAIVDIVEVHRRARERGAGRGEVLADMAALDGVYVPALYEPVVDEHGRFEGMRAAPGAPPVVRKRVLQTLEDPTPCPVVPFADVVHDRLTVEVTRGCTRGCRFCQAGMVYRPVRERAPDDIVRTVMAGLACTGYEEVSLTSLSTTDHSRIEEVLRRLTRRLDGTATAVSLPSLRVDSFGVDMARLVSTGKKSGLTFAPEAGTQRLRDVINKNVRDEDLLDTVREAFEAGWRRVKLYFMIGLPTETDEDVRGIGELVAAVLRTAREAVEPAQRGSIRIGVSVSTFVPKAETPFQWEGQLAHAEIERRQAVLRDAVPRKGVDLSWHDADVSFVEGVLARGGRELAPVIEHVWRAGGAFDAWTERFSLERWRDGFAAEGIDAAALAQQPRSPETPSYWDHLSSGVSRAYLRAERTRALEGATTPDCSFDGCTGCDVCGDLGVDIVVNGARHG